MRRLIVSLLSLCAFFTLAADSRLGVAGTEAAERENGSTLRTFRVNGSEFISFVTTNNGMARGLIHTPEGPAILEYDGVGAARLTRADTRLVCETERSERSPDIEANAAGGGKRRSVRVPSPEKIVVRIMIAISPESLAAAGGADKAELEAQALVDQLNVIARDSGYPFTSFKLVGAPVVSLAPTGNSSKDLAALSASQEIAELRKFYRADLVGLMTESDNGRAYGPTLGWNSFVPSQAFFVFPRKYALLTYIFPHEVGHCLGMQHNIEDSGGTNIPAAYGFHNDEAPELKDKFGDVMNVYRNYPAVPLFATTLRTWKGKAIGSPEANAAWLLTEGARRVAEYGEKIQ